MEAGKRQNRKLIKIDAHGGYGGNFWDDGAFTGIREITLTYDHCIDSIRVEYDLNGKPALAEKHGGAGGQYTAHVKLQYPDEVLTKVSGYLNPVVRGGTPVVRSLTFKSNKRSWGPYGIEQGTPFSFSMDGGAIVGFHGRSGWYLDSIGFRLAPLHNRGGFHDMVMQKLRSFGALASKTLGYSDVEQETPARTAKVSG
ncbi:unnamed protein product [Victoria cruziana]